MMIGADLIKRVDELHDALEEYGEHKPYCAFIRSYEELRPTEPCDCGLDKILYGE